MAQFNIYWDWDPFGRVWVYNSDDGSQTAFGPDGSGVWSRTVLAVDLEAPPPPFVAWFCDGVVDPTLPPPSFRRFFDTSYVREQPWARRPACAGPKERYPGM
jgi:hypothetical protein